MQTSPRRGRPMIDDTPALMKVAEMLERQPHLKPRSAILRTVGQDTAAIRRLQRKWRKHEQKFRMAVQSRAREQAPASQSSTPPHGSLGVLGIREIQLVDPRALQEMQKAFALPEVREMQRVLISPQFQEMQKILNSPVMQEMSRILNSPAMSAIREAAAKMNLFNR